MLFLSFLLVSKHFYCAPLLSSHISVIEQLGMMHILELVGVGGWGRWKEGREVGQIKKISELNLKYVPPCLKKKKNGMGSWV